VKNNFVFFLGVFAALGVSYASIVIGSNAQLGSLPPYYDENESNAFPQWFPGVAARGQLVYRDLGCAACHTQQVRRPGSGSDEARGWGERQSVARDYIYQPSPQLGMSRVGPDLANLGDRKPTAPDSGDLLTLLYAGAEGMPSYRFLFEKRHIGSGAQPSDDALKLVGRLEPSAGWEVVPTQRAKDLAGYLLNLKSSYDYPEAVPYSPPKPEGAKPAKAPAAAAVPAPAATPAGGPAPKPSPANQVPSSPAGAPAPSAAPAVGPTAAPPAPSGAPAPAAAPSPTGAPSPSATPAPSGTGGAK